MASISRDPNQRKRILFVGQDGVRRTIRLGKMTMKQAEWIKIRVEQLLTAQITGALDPEAAKWLQNMDDTMHDRLARQGLAESREKGDRTLSGFLDAYFDALDVKETTRTRYGQTRKLLEKHFGKAHDIRKIRTKDADEWRASLVDRYAPAKVAREVGLARMFFGRAMRWGLISTNPFAGVKAGSQRNRERLHYVTPEDTAKLLTAAGNADWRCIIALARYGGLRCPSEVLAVRWEDVDWDAGRVRVRSPKTDGHDGKGERVLPLFPELRDELMEAF